MTETVRFILCASLAGLGVLMIYLGLFGVFRFRFVLNRMHAAAIVDTLGALLLLAALAVGTGTAAYLPKLAVILAFLWISSPLSSHMVAKMELSVDKTAKQHMKQKTEGEAEHEPL